MPAPRPVESVRAQPGSDGVERDVAKLLEQLRVRSGPNRVVPALEEVPSESVPAVEPLRVQRLETLHARCERHLGRPDHEVEVVAHEAVRQALPLEAHCDSGQGAQERDPVMVIGEDRRLPVPSRGHVIGGTGFLKAKRSRHTQTRREAPNLAPQGGQTPLPRFAGDSTNASTFDVPPGGSDPLMGVCRAIGDCVHV